VIYLITAFLAFVVAQGLKYLIIAIRTGKNDWRESYMSGGMPSAHSATVTSMAVIVGILNGVNSAIFAVIVLMAFIVMYDAIMVRRSNGEIGASLTTLIKKEKFDVRLPRVAKGHTPAEVVVGAIIGAAVAIVAVCIYNLF